MARPRTECGKASGMVPRFVPPKLPAPDIHTPSPCWPHNYAATTPRFITDNTTPMAFHTAVDRCHIITVVMQPRTRQHPLLAPSRAGRTLDRSSTSHFFDLHRWSSNRLPPPEQHPPSPSENSRHKPIAILIFIFLYLYLYIYSIYIFILILYIVYSIYIVFIYLYSYYI